MPVTNGVYVNPGWKNGQAPALDATELNAISDTLAAAQSKNVSQDSLISALQTAVGGKGQVAVGSYVGTGTYGADNPNSITFPFTPKLVWLYSIMTPQSGTIFPGRTPPINQYYPYNFIITWGELTTSYQGGVGFWDGTDTSDAYNYTPYAKKTGNTLFWYTGANPSSRGNAKQQCNENGYTYKWMILG